MIRGRIAEHLAASAKVATALAEDQRALAQLVEVADRIAATFLAGGRVLACGNGGSAADAAHFCGELVGRYRRERPALAAWCLSEAGATLTAVANDYGYERSFSRQVAAFGRRDDVLIALSTSGSSVNVLRAMERATADGLHVVGLTGPSAPDEFERLCHWCLVAPSQGTALVQQCHAAMLHALADAVEDMMFTR